MIDVKVMLDKGATIPFKAHSSDGGFDICTPQYFVMKPFQSRVIDTGVHMLIPDGYCGLLVSKSGLNIKNNITGTGLIDAGYTGAIKVRLQNGNSEVKVFESGDKIIQIVILPIPEVNIIQVREFDVETERGDNGFGSSGA